MRVIYLSVAITALCLCLVVPPYVQATVGHTIRNGGGGAELVLKELWGSLPARLNSCLHPANPCGLNAQQTEAVQKVLAQRKVNALDLKNLSLYDSIGRPLKRQQILSVLLRAIAVSSCESALELTDWESVAKQIESTKKIYFLSASAALWYKDGSFRFANETVRLDLMSALKTRLGVDAGSVIELSSLTIEGSGEGFEVRGRATLGSKLDAKFSILIEHEREFVDILEGGYGSSKP